MLFKVPSQRVAPFFTDANNFFSNAAARNMSMYLKEKKNNDCIKSYCHLIYQLRLTTTIHLYRDPVTCIKCAYTLEQNGIFRRGLKYFLDDDDYIMLKHYINYIKYDVLKVFFIDNAFIIYFSYNVEELKPYLGLFRIKFKGKCWNICQLTLNSGMSRNNTIWPQNKNIILNEHK